MISEQRLRAGGAVLLVLVVAVVAGYTLTKLPDVTESRLPWAAGGSHTYPVTAQFSDVLDLVPNSTVRLADVAIGRVTSIDVGTGGPQGHLAVVHLQINDAYHLPASTRATISSTSLLGEKYVALTAPAGGTGSLQSTASIPLAHTTQDVEVEQILASLGALLNGGGLQQLSTITEQFSNALHGHEQDTRELLGNLDQIVGQLDRGRGVLVAALDSANRLSRALAAQNQVIGNAVDALDPATGVLARQQHALTRALTSLQTLDGKAHRIISDSTDATVADLNSLAPVARELGKVAKYIPESFTVLVTYPFADDAIPAFSGAYGAVKGIVDIDLPQLLASVVPTATTAGASNPVSVPAPRAGTPATSHSSTKPTRSGLLGLLGLEGPQPGDTTKPHPPQSGVVGALGGLLHLLGGS